MENIIKTNKCWILVKPETLYYYATDLKKILENNGFAIKEKRSSNNYLELSVQIYKKASQFSPMHKAINMYLFGEKANYCEIWFLENIEELDRISAFSKLGAIKKDFRKRHHIEGLKIDITYLDTKNAFGFGFFHVPDPDDIDFESRIIEKYS